MKNTLESVIAKSNEAKVVLESCGVVLHEQILVKVFSTSIELILCEDTTMAKRIFGGDVTINGHVDWGTKNRRIELNCGSMGSFTPECQASTQKVFTQAAILSNWSEFKIGAALLMDQVEVANQLSMLTSKK